MQASNRNNTKHLGFGDHVPLFFTIETKECTINKRKTINKKGNTKNVRKNIKHRK